MLHRVCNSSDQRSVMAKVKQARTHARRSIARIDDTSFFSQSIKERITHSRTRAILQPASRVSGDLIKPEQQPSVAFKAMATVLRSALKGAMRRRGLWPSA